ncbi:1-acyl-sn-glycerol-3-phosphate acyltransferase [Rubrivirga sp.]|uniref:1-acyl-sn-glycerol-3-phosphate acyltransferase n=1 Tax=Rubrivirga sp. TaxID=1885344 RepID=UPI003B524DA6
MPDAAPLPFRYRALRAVVRAVVRLFFRDVAVAGTHHVPQDRGGLLVAWHPNGLIDPALILSTVPGRIVFGARDGLLRWPVVGPMMRALGTVPIYRAVDQDAMTPEERRAANDRSLGALADEIAGGSFSALFPEGVSHDRPHLSEIRSGAARLYLQARERTPAGRPPPVIVPVGLHYEDKDTFRTDVLVAFHRPLDLAEMDLDAPDAPDVLTDAIEEALVAAVHPTASWRLHALMHRARTLIAAEAAARRGERPAPETVVSRTAGFAQIWEGYRVRSETHPDEIEALRQDIAAYHHALHRLGLDDGALDRPPRLGSAVLVVGAIAQAVAVALLLPPLLLVGFAVNAPPYWALKGVALLAAKAAKDAATVKIFGGLVLFPLAWATAGLLAALGVVRLADVMPDLPEAPVAVGLVIAALSALGGVAALLYSEIAVGAWRAIRVRVARWRHYHQIDGLRRRRASLHDRFLALADGLDLPTGVVPAERRDSSVRSGG